MLQTEPKSSLIVVRDGAELQERRIKTMVMSDLDLQALVDGELNREDEECALIVLSHDPVCRARYEQLKMQKELMISAFAPEVAKEQIH